MGQLKRISESGSATVACLIVVALLAVPLCAPGCSGMPCFAQNASSRTPGHCHGMSDTGEAHFRFATVVKSCDLAGIVPAVLNRPVVNEFKAVEKVAGFSSAIRSAAVLFAGGSSHLHCSSASPPLKLQSEKVASFVLRI